MLGINVQVNFKCTFAHVDLFIHSITKEKYYQSF